MPQGVDWVRARCGRSSLRVPNRNMGVSGESPHLFAARRWIVDGTDRRAFGVAVTASRKPTAVLFSTAEPPAAMIPPECADPASGRLRFHDRRGVVGIYRRIRLHRTRRQRRVTGADRDRRSRGGANDREAGLCGGAVSRRRVGHLFERVLPAWRVEASRFVSADHSQRTKRDPPRLSFRREHLERIPARFDVLG